MKEIQLGGSLSASAVSLGVMRLKDLPDDKKRAELVYSAFAGGVNFFDNADIYGTEEMFGKAVKDAGLKRDEILVQTKCGLCGGYWDFSKKHILESVDKSLKKMGIEYLDVLLLHRPDTLMEPEEVAEAFDVLTASGKVRNFGVSNHNMMQIALLQKYVHQKILINQMQFSAAHTPMIDFGLNVNMHNDAGVNRDGSLIEYCRLEDITIQAWSPFQHGFFAGSFLGSDKFPELNRVIDRIAGEYGVTNTTIAAAWILRHPAKMQVIAGTTSAKRIQEIAAASEITLRREEWYEIYRAAGNKMP